MKFTKIPWEMRKEGSCGNENRKIVGIMKKPAVILLLVYSVILLCACGNTFMIKVVGGEDLLIDAGFNV